MFCYYGCRMDDSIDIARGTIATRVIRYWLPVGVMLAAMYYFSTDVFSSENTRSVIEKVFLWFVHHPSRHALVTFHYVVRKSAHFTEYAILGALLFRAFRAENKSRWRFRWALYSFLTAVSWALLDELHQTFTRMRGGSINDSFLDSSGALFALACIWLLSRRSRSDSSTEA